MNPRVDAPAETMASISSPGEQAAPKGTRPSTTSAWMTLALLVVLYCLSFVDRMILALLAAPVSKTLHISDTQMSLILGLGFGVLYALVGLPLAQGLDRRHRIRIIAGGVTLWSLCTIGSGFAQSYAQLLVLRSGVAIGEAVLSPAAVSLIGDMFALERRTLPMAIYTSVAAFMATGAFVVGGAALDMAKAISPHIGMEPWRLTLVLVGLPSLCLAALLISTIREPARTGATVQAASHASPRKAWLYLVRHGRLYGCVFVGMAASTIISYGFVSWTPTFMVRAFGESPAHAGYGFGMAGLPAGLCGATLWPWLSRQWMARGRQDAVVVLLAVGVAGAGACAVVAGIAPSPIVVLAATFGYILMSSTTGMLPPLIIQYVTPADLRARVMAGNLMATSLIGLAVGPTLIAALGEHVFSGPRALGSALAASAAILGPLSFVAIWLASRGYAKAADAQAQIEARAV